MQLNKIQIRAQMRQSCNQSEEVLGPRQWATCNTQGTKRNLTLSYAVLYPEDRVHFHIKNRLLLSSCTYSTRNTQAICLWIKKNSCSCIVEYMALWHQTPCKDMSLVLPQWGRLTCNKAGSTPASATLQSSMTETICIQSSWLWNTVYEKKTEEQFLSEVCPLKTSLMDLWLSPC